MKEGLHLGGGLLLLPPEVDAYSFTTAPSRAPKLRRQISKRAMASRIRNLCNLGKSNINVSFSGQLFLVGLH